jgi:hypothetical protein
MFLFVDRDTFGSPCFRFKGGFDIVEIQFLASVLIGDTLSFLGTKLDDFIPHLLVQPLEEFCKTVDIRKGAFRNEDNP